jgi:beta-lactamase regulating signal transducer with metallopeptidase domain
MNAEACLHFAATCLSYLMRVTAGYFVCSMLSRLLRKPDWRFLVWMGFLLGSTGYWLELLVSEFRAFATGRADVDGLPFSAPAVAHSLQVPLAWSYDLRIFIQGLALVYISTALGLVGFAVWKHLRLRVLLRRGIEPSEALSGLFLEIRREMRMSRSGISRAKLVILPGLKSPATAGWWNPRILLPGVCEEIGATPQVGDMLSHELIHIARRDYFWGALSELIRCLLFFHPAVWKARTAMALQGELACDLAVLETRPGDRADYADSLTYFVRLRMLQEGFSLGVDFAASTSLGLRIRTILSVPQPVPWWKRFSRMTAGLIVAAVFGIIAPAMTVSLGFAESVGGPVSSYRPESTMAAEHVHAARHTLKHTSSHAATQDSLSTFRTLPFAAEAPAHTMTSSSGSRPGSERGDQDSPAWRETQPSIQYPSISSVVRSTLGEIATRGVHGGHDHDRDDHFK